MPDFQPERAVPALPSVIGAPEREFIADAVSYQLAVGL
jgi:hypothetical protein